MNIKLLFAVSVLTAFSLSCQDPDLLIEADTPKEDGPVRVKVNLSCEPLDTETEEETKSMHDVSALRKITNVNYYLFRRGSLVGQEYFGNADDFAVSIPSEAGQYDLYILANVGRKTVSSDILDTEMAAGVHQDYMNRDNYFNTIGTYGFPMSTIVRGFSISGDTNIPLRRLVHTLYVKVDTEALSTTEMEFTGLSIRNAARDVYPFAEESKAQYFIDGDAASLDAVDLKTLNDGGQVTLFLIENMRGKVFSGNKDWKKKVPDNMNPASERDCASYIELTASARTATAYYENNIYRAYIGSSAEDCNVKRHVYSTLNNRFTNDMIEDEEWRIEGDTPVITETLAFVETSGSQTELSSTKLYPGFKRDFYIYRSNKDIEYTLSGPSASSPPYLNYTTTKINDNYTKVTVFTFTSWNDDLSRNSTGSFEIRSKDGLISKSLSCSVIVDPVTVKFSYGPESTKYGYQTYCPSNLMISVKNELNLGFELDISGAIGYYLKHYPKGTNKTHEIKSDSFEYESGTTAAIYPAVNTNTIVDQYINTSSYSNVSGYGLYHALLTAWEVTGHQSTRGNDPSSSYGYDKHALLTKLYMYITIRYGKSKDGTLYPASSSTTIPLNITNLQFTQIGGLNTYAGGGTDFGVYWNHHSGNPSSTYEKILFDKTVQGPYGVDAQGISVSVNGIREWSDNMPQASYMGY